jgi:spermidine synthase
VLILGGGDGLAAREVLRYAHVAGVTLVDLDPAMTALFATHPALTALNARALADPRLRVVNADAFTWLRADTGRYDFVVVDFPDPSNFSLGKLYSQTFYRVLQARLAPGGGVVVQSTSPWVARRAYWCVDATLRSVGLRTEPYHAHVPAFGEWGYVLAWRGAAPRGPAALPAGLRFYTAASWPQLQHFAPDMGPLPTEVNRLNNQVLVQYFTQAWQAYE